MANKLIIFDLDGTLIDTSHDLLASLNFCLSTVQLNPVKHEELISIVGQGAKVMISRAFELNNARLSEAELRRLFNIFLSHYEENMPGLSKPYPGLCKALERLRQADYTLAVCTNKLENMAVRLLDCLSMSERFSTVTGGDTFAYQKPDGRHLLKTIERAHAQIADTMMIGDSINDIVAAKNINIPSIAVSFGFSDVPVKTLHPDAIISHYDQLTTDLIETIFNKRLLSGQKNRL